MLRRLLRVATAASLGRAWAQKSLKWLAVALGIAFFRFIDRRAAKAAKPSKREST